MVIRERINRGCVGVLVVLVTGAGATLVVAIGVTLAGVDVEGVSEEGRLLAGLVEGHFGILHVDPWGLDFQHL